MKKHFFLSLLCASAATLSAGNLLEIPAAAKTPVIDGVMAPAEWDDAAVFTGLQLTNDRGLAKEQTKFYMKWDKDFIYIAAVCRDSNVKEINPKLPYNDCLEFFFMAPGELDVVHWLVYATGGNTLDFIDSEYGSGYRANPGRIKNAAKINEKDWTLECRIPAESFFKEFFDPKYSYKFNACRAFSHNGTVRPDGRHAEFSGFSHVRGQLLKPHDFAELRLNPQPVVPVRLERLDEKGMLVTAAPDSVVTLTFEDGKVVKVPGNNGKFFHDFPENCPGVTLRVLRDNGEMLLCNRYRFFPVDTETPKKIAAEQAKTRGLGVDVVNSMERIFHTKPYVGGNDSVKLTAARNERENFQIILFTGKDAVRNITVQASEFRSADGKVLSASVWELYREGYAIADPVGYPVVNGTGDYPDPLYPLTPLSLDPMQVRAVWAGFKVPVDAAPGEYAGTVTVSADGKPVKTINVSLRVWDFAIPKKQSLRTAFCIWEREIYNLYFNGKKRSVEEFRQTIHRYGMMLAEHRVSPLVFKTDRLLPKEVIGRIGPVYDDKQPDGSMKYHPNAYDDMVRDYLAAGATCFYIGPETPPSDYKKYSEEEWKAIWKALYDHYKANGLLKYAYAYPFDEPGNANRDFVNRRMALIKEAAPGLKLLLTGACSLFPSTKFSDINIWVPQSHWVHYRNKKEVQDAGKEVWWYPCSGPWFPYPNYHLDIEPGAWRILTWATYKYKFDGILYWATAFFNTKNPLKNNSYSVNGDGVLMYSLPDGNPTPSIRLKVISDSMEDYEYLVMLRDAAEKQKNNPDKVQAVENAREMLKLKDMIRHIDDYALDSKAYDDFRIGAATLIEELNRK